MTVKPHQVWREVDPRFARFARILSVGKGRRSIQIRTVIKIGDDWVFAPHSRPTWCDQARFNGKRGGYELYEEPALMIQIREKKDG